MRGATIKIAVGTLFDHKMNEQILVDLNVQPADEKLRSYKSKWLRHVTIMNSSRMTKIVLNCRPIGRRRIGRALRRLLDEGETDLSRLN